MKKIRPVSSQCLLKYKYRGQHYFKADIYMFIDGDLPHLEYPAPGLLKLTAVPPAGSSRKMFDALYSMALNKMLLNLYLNANFDGVLRSSCPEYHSLQ